MSFRPSPQIFLLLFLNFVMNPLYFRVFLYVLEGRIILVNVPLGTALSRGESVQLHIRNELSGTVKILLYEMDMFTQFSKEIRLFGKTRNFNYRVHRNSPVDSFLSHTFLSHTF
jgi:hypothetical protein